MTLRLIELSICNAASPLGDAAEKKITKTKQLFFSQASSTTAAALREFSQASSTSATALRVFPQASNTFATALRSFLVFSNNVF
jgi:hypothetical protein